MENQKVILMVPDSIHELLQPNDRVFWSNGKHTVYLNTRENIKILDHTSGRKIDYFSDKVYPDNPHRIVPQRVVIWCSKLHGIFHEYQGRSLAQRQTTSIKECPQSYSLIEYGKVKK